MTVKKCGGLLGHTRKLNIPVKDNVSPNSLPMSGSTTQQYRGINQQLSPSITSSSPPAVTTAFQSPNTDRFAATSVQDFQQEMASFFGQVQQISNQNMSSNQYQLSFNIVFNALQKAFEQINEIVLSNNKKTTDTVAAVPDHNPLLEEAEPITTHENERTQDDTVMGDVAPLPVSKSLTQPNNTSTNNSNQLPLASTTAVLSPKTAASFAGKRLSEVLDTLKTKKQQVRESLKNQPLSGSQRQAAQEKNIVRLHQELQTEEFQRKLSKTSEQLGALPPSIPDDIANWTKAEVNRWFRTIFHAQWAVHRLEKGLPLVECPVCHRASDPKEHKCLIVSRRPSQPQRGLPMMNQIRTTTDSGGNLRFYQERLPDPNRQQQLINKLHEAGFQPTTQSQPFRRDHPSHLSRSRSPRQSAPQEIIPTQLATNSNAATGYTDGPIEGLPTILYPKESNVLPMSLAEALKLPTSVPYGALIANYESLRCPIGHHTRWLVTVQQPLTVEPVFVPNGVYPTKSAPPTILGGSNTVAAIPTASPLLNRTLAEVTSNIINPVLPSSTGFEYTNTQSISCPATPLLSIGTQQTQESPFFRSRQAFQLDR